MGWDLREIVVADISKTLALLKTSFQGLLEDQTEDLLKTYGPNEIERFLKKSLLSKIIDCLIEPMVIILFVAAAFSLVIGNKIEAVAILGVVFINTAISLIQDGNAERAVEELKKILSPQFRVLRCGRLEIIASRFIVPGDLLVFESGDIILTDDNLSITLVMVFAIVYLPALNIIFTTKPIFEWHIWVLIFSMSFLTSIFRLIVGSIWRKGYKNE